MPAHDTLLPVVKTKGNRGVSLDDLWSFYEKLKNEIKEEKGEKKKIKDEMEEYEKIMNVLDKEMLKMMKQDMLRLRMLEIRKRLKELESEANSPENPKSKKSEEDMFRLGKELGEIKAKLDMLTRNNNKSKDNQEDVFELGKELGEIKAKIEAIIGDNKGGKKESGLEIVRETISLLKDAGVVGEKNTESLEALKIKREMQRDAQEFQAKLKLMELQQQRELAKMLAEQNLAKQRANLIADALGAIGRGIGRGLKEAGEASEAAGSTPPPYLRVRCGNCGAEATIPSSLDSFVCPSCGVENRIPKQQ